MKSTSWQAYDHYAYAAIATFGTVLAVVVIWWAMETPPFAVWTRSLAGVAAPFINVVGVLFGLTLAFLANDTWTAHDRAVNAVLQEADAVRSLAVLARGLGPAARADLEGAIAACTRASIAEWPLLARCATAPEADTSADALLALAATKTVAGDAGTTVQGRMLQDVTAIRSARDLRIGLSQTHVNPLKWLGMAFLGFLTLLSVAVVHADNPRAALVSMVLFGLAGAPTAAIVLIHGNPFQPPSAVLPVPLEKVLALIPGQG